MGYYGDGGWSGVGMLVMVVLFAAVVGAVVWAVVRSNRREVPGREAISSPRQILDRRLAVGEIDEEQYAQTRRVLDGRGLDKGGL